MAQENPQQANPQQDVNAAGPNGPCGPLGHRLTSNDIRQFEQSGKESAGGTDCGETASTTGNNKSASDQDTSGARQPNARNANGSIPTPGEEIPKPADLSRWEGEKQPFPPMDVSNDQHPNSVWRNEARNDTRANDNRSAYDNSERDLVRHGLNGSQSRDQFDNSNHQENWEGEANGGGSFHDQSARNDQSGPQDHIDMSRNSDQGGQDQDQNGYSDQETPQGQHSFDQDRNRSASKNKGWNDENGSGDQADNSFDRSPDKSANNGGYDESDRQSGGNWRENRRFGNRRLGIAHRALFRAREVVPGANFTDFQFQVRNGRRLVEISGRDIDTGRPVEVDVAPGGRVLAIGKIIPFDAVPDDVRQAVRDELTGFKVDHTLKSIRPNLDVYYEFEGKSRSGEPGTIDVRADGGDLTIHFPKRNS
jgi:hypothetical protein